MEAPDMFHKWMGSQNDRLHHYGNQLPYQDRVAPESEETLLII